MRVPTLLQHGLRRFCSDSTNSVDCVVIGAGVVGLACARALALAGKEVIILDRANHWGTETSARHSEVIHAGLYYPPESLKAQFCVQGKHMLYEYCAQKSVPHRRVTKLIVACTDAQIAGLRSIHECASANGVNDLMWLTADEIKTLEPQLEGAAGLLSPSTGILDSHTYMSALLADAESAGASLAVASKVIGGSVIPKTPAQAGGVDLDVMDLQSGQKTRIRARNVVNAAGLWSQHVSHSIQGIPTTSIPHQYLARGVYFTLAGTKPTTTSTTATTTSTSPTAAAAAPHHDGTITSLQPQLSSPPSPSPTPTPSHPPPPSHPINAASPMTDTLAQVATLPGTQPFPTSSSRPFSRLIYPLPQDGGLGVHLTLDMGGGVRFGPDVEWVDTVDYTVDPKRGDAFYSAIRTYWPGLPDGALQPGYAGVRPKLSGPKQPAADFMVQGARMGRDGAGHGVPGLVCLYGIESPGLTSSLAIAEHVRELLLGK